MRKSSWSVFGRLLARRSLIAGVAGAAAFLAVPSLSSAAEEQFQANLGELIVHGGPLVSFDISWVDPDPASPVRNFYFLADRSNAQIDSIPIEVNPPSFFIKPAAFPFAGSVLCPDGAANDCAGPNGVLTFNPDPEGTFEIWSGDGPTANVFCPPGLSPCSTVKVFQGFAVNLLAVIPTATSATFPGKKRADELCFAPKTAAHPGTILVANDADDPPYITFIATDGPNRTHILKQIAFPQATAGIEQCQFDPNTDLFYLNLPEDSNFGGDGTVHRFSAMDFSEAGPFDISTAVCEHPQGMAITSNVFQPTNPETRFILLGCNGATTGGTLDSVIINSITGATTARLPNEGGADEVWWEPGSFMWFIAEGGCTSNCGLNKQGIEQLGIIDIASVAKNTEVSDPFNGGQDVFIGFAGNTTRRAHSVAAWSGTLGTLGPFTIAFVPVPATGGSTGGTAGFSSTLCNQFSAQGCVGMIATPSIPGFIEELTE
jgi:hypothetical protein